MLESFFLNEIVYDSSFPCTERSGNSDDKHKVNIKDKYIGARYKTQDSRTIYYLCIVYRLSYINNSIAIYPKE